MDLKRFAEIAHTSKKEPNTKIKKRKMPWKLRAWTNFIDVRPI